MRLILLGAPGAGKGTQAEILSRILNVPTISTGNILRAAIKDGTPVGLQAEAYINAGRLVPDEVIIGIIKGAPRAARLRRRLYPRRRAAHHPQAEAMEKMGVEIDYALSIEVHDDVIVRRMSGRRTCKDCSATFHVESNPRRQRAYAISAAGSCRSARTTPRTP